MCFHLLFVNRIFLFFSINIFFLYIYFYFSIKVRKVKSCEETFVFYKMLLTLNRFNAIYIPRATKYIIKKKFETFFFVYVENRASIVRK